MTQTTLDHKWIGDKEVGCAHSRLVQCTSTPITTHVERGKKKVQFSDFILYTTVCVGPSVTTYDVILILSLDSYAQPSFFFRWVVITAAAARTVGGRVFSNCSMVEGRWNRE